MPQANGIVAPELMRDSRTRSSCAAISEAVRTTRTTCGRSLYARCAFIVLSRYSVGQKNVRPLMKAKKIFVEPTVNAVDSRAMLRGFWSRKTTVP